MAIQDVYKNLTDQQKAKIKACKDQKEILRLISEEGIELTDEQMEAIAGGSSASDWVKKMPPE